MTSLASAAVLAVCALAATAAIDGAVDVSAGRGHRRPGRCGRGGGALLAAHDRPGGVADVPPTAVTRRISDPMATVKFGAGKPASLATVIVVSVAVDWRGQRGAGRQQAGHGLADGAESRGDVAWVICVVVGHSPLRATVAPSAATAAVVPCWPRTTVQVVPPAPLTSVTSRISAPIVT